LIDGLLLESKERLNDAQLDCYYGSACVLGDAKFRQRAEGYYQRAASKDNSLASAWMGLGDVAMAKGDSIAAKRDYRQAAQVDPTSFEALLKYGRALVVEDSMAEASEVLGRALAIDPTHAFARGYYAWSQLNADPIRGLQALEPVRQQLPWDGRFTALAIVLKMRVGDLEGANAELARFREWGSPELVEWVEGKLSEVEDR
jgi:tetratricopeptide (TPR) repeat protein